MSRLSVAVLEVLDEVWPPSSLAQAVVGVLDDVWPPAEVDRDTLDALRRGHQLHEIQPCSHDTGADTTAFDAAMAKFQQTPWARQEGTE
jgi:hypothetical protein